jgi:hypothetical protein
MAAVVIEGIELLRAKRGNESVTFGDIADHLVEFEELYPSDAEAIDRLASFLARVEDADHSHDGSG